MKHIECTYSYINFTWECMYKYVCTKPCILSCFVHDLGIGSQVEGLPCTEWLSRNQSNKSGVNKTNHGYKVVVLSWLHNSQFPSLLCRCSCLLPPPPPPLPPPLFYTRLRFFYSLSLPSTAAAGSSPLTSPQPHVEPFGSWSVAAAVAAQFPCGAASGASFSASANAVWGFWKWQFRTG